MAVNCRPLPRFSAVSNAPIVHTLDWVSGEGQSLRPGQVRAKARVIWRLHLNTVLLSPTRLHLNPWMSNTVLAGLLWEWEAFIKVNIEKSHERVYSQNIFFLVSQMKSIWTLFSFQERCDSGIPQNTKSFEIKRCVGSGFNVKQYTPSSNQPKLAHWPVQEC